MRSVVDTPDPEPAPVVPDIVAKLDEVDSQHLLVIGGAAFAVVALIFIVSSFGGAPPSDVDAASTAGAVTMVPAADSATSAPATPMIPGAPSGSGAPGSTTPDAGPPEQLALDEVTTTVAMIDAEADGPGPNDPGLELLDPAQSVVYRLYQTALGRPPDREGFEFWADEVRRGADLTILADSFVISDEYEQQFETAAGDREVLRRLVENGLGEPVTDAMMPTWLGRVNGLTWSEAIVAIAESDEVVAATGTIR